MNALGSLLPFRPLGMVVLFAATQISAAADISPSTQAAGPARTAWHVANNGADSDTCGKRNAPCRSLSQAIVNAADGDLILVGPGRYGVDLHGNLSTPFPEEGEEFGVCAPVCVDKRLTVASVAGAEATVIDGGGTSFPVVMLVANGSVFGTPQKGFTLINSINIGLSIEARNDAKASSNIAQGNRTGFQAELEFNHRLVGNLAIDNEIGFHIRAIDVRIVDNVAVSNKTGIRLSNINTFAARNLAVANDIGFAVTGVGHFLLRNSVIGNRNFGIDLFPDFLGTGIDRISIEQTNIYGNNNVPLNGNVNCGILNRSNATIIASNNFWGAPTGPGTDPADEACNVAGGGIVLSSFAAEEFPVRQRSGF